MSAKDIAKWQNNQKQPKRVQVQKPMDKPHPAAPKPGKMPKHK